MVMVALAVVAGAVYLGAKVLVSRTHTRILLVPGLEHLGLGLLLGPMVFAVGMFGERGALAPFAALAAGWVALSCGTDFNLRALSDPPRGGPRLGVLSALLSGGLVAGAAWIGLSSNPWLNVSSEDAWFQAGCLGCASAAATMAPLDVLQRRYQLSEGLGLMLRRAARFANGAAIVCFGLLFCLYHNGQAIADRPLSSVELAVVAVGLGAVLGLVFSPFLGRAETLAGRVLVLAAMVAFACGAAFWLELSPLWVGLVMGAVLINTTPTADRMVEAVRAANPTTLVVLFVLAGALWSPPPLVPALVFTGGTIVLRLVGRLVGSWLAARTMTALRGDLGRGLLGQGAVTLAMAISFRLVHEGPVADVVYTAIVGSTIVHHFVSAWGLRGLLIDAGEMRGELGART